MSFKLIVEQEADDEVIQATIFYNEKSPEVAERFLSELLSTYKKLAVNPEYYKFANKGRKLRCISMLNFPFLVIYSISGNEVIIVSVHNTNRRNKYLR